MSPYSAASDNAENLFVGDLMANSIEGVVHAAVGEINNRIHGIDHRRVNSMRGAELFRKVQFGVLHINGDNRIS